MVTITMNGEKGVFTEKRPMSAQDFSKMFEQPFCMINKGKELLIYQGEIEEYERIGDLPALDRKGVNYIAMMPFCQIKERGFETYDAGEKILNLRIKDFFAVDLEAFSRTIPETKLELENGIQSDLSDAEFEEIVQRVIEDEIKNGEGSNFLMSRKFLGRVKDFKFESILSVLKRLIANEIGSYWNFIFYTGEQAFVGASPERHLSIEGITSVMNPICGTLPKLGEGEFKDRLEEFIMNPKEINELFQVLDEELKIICKLCPEGGRVDGPYLKEMGTLIHTEYFLEGKGHTDLWWGLKESLFAATMVGSPLQNAARIIKKHEKNSRRYYSSVICQFGRDENEQDFLDTAITIRTMEIKKTGDFVIQSGASIVRDSVPELECKEIKAKAQGLINALLMSKKREVILPQYFDRELETKLYSRNKYLSEFWLKPFETRNVVKNNRRIDLIDNEDDFIYMLKHMLDDLGYSTHVYKYFEYQYNPAAEIVVIGPGPGDPNNRNHDKMDILYEITEGLLQSKSKILGICLGHQILSKTLGYELQRARIPFQGMQKEIKLFGEPQNVGFYNSYFAIDHGNPEFIVSKDEEERIIALKGKNLISFQFHVESVLTQYGLEILKGALNYLLD